MRYFNGITDLEQAKLCYRNLAKKLHPDAGGTAHEFQIMQEEYKTVLIQLQQNRIAYTTPQHPSAENELLHELGNLANRAISELMNTIKNNYDVNNVLIKKQVPQNYFKQKIQTTESPLKKGLFGNIVDLLDSIK